MQLPVALSGYRPRAGQAGMVIDDDVLVLDGMRGSAELGVPCSDCRVGAAALASVADVASNRI